MLPSMPASAATSYAFSYAEVIGSASVSCVSVNGVTSCTTSEANIMANMILLVAALILFILAAVNVPSPKVNLVAAGLACLTAAWMLIKFNL